MKKLLIGTFLLLASASGYSQDLPTVTKEVCYTDLNVCGLYTKRGGTTVSITITDNEGRYADNEFRNHLISDLGIEVYQIAPQDYGKVKAASRVTETRTTTAAVEAYGLATISDEAWTLAMESSGCAIAIVGCGGAAFVTAETGGLTIFIMRSSCVGAGLLCTSAYRSYQKWDVYQQNKKLQDEQLQLEIDEAKKKKAEEAAKAGSGSTGASSGVPGFPVGTGLGGGVKEDAEVPCDACVITEW
jgi:hypothetical protein